jgi:hypothetical protein
MSKVPKSRLCWNCEGSVSIAEETCPFCGVSVVPASLDGPISNFAPPYNPHAHQDNHVPHSPYGHSHSHSHTEEVAPEHHKRAAHVVEEAAPEIDEFKKVLQAVTLLLSGSVFFLFGLALVLFSTNGTFVLQWNGALWFVYTLLSLPLLFFGWRALMKLD